MTGRRGCERKNNLREKKEKLRLQFPRHLLSARKTPKRQSSPSFCRLVPNYFSYFSHPLLPSARIAIGRARGKRFHRGAGRGGCSCGTSGVFRASGDTYQVEVVTCSVKMLSGTLHCFHHAPHPSPIASLVSLPEVRQDKLLHLQTTIWESQKWSLPLSFALRKESDAHTHARSQRGARQRCRYFLVQY